VGYFDQFAGHYKSLEGADLWVKTGTGGPVISMAGDGDFMLRACGEGYAVYVYHGQRRFTRFFHKPDGTVLGLFHGNSMTGIRLVPKVE
jgi:hypothetical protein